MTCEDLGPYRKAGRPAQTHCKRGHQHPRGSRCIECRKIRDNGYYDQKKDEKKEYMKAWRSDFKIAFNMPYGTAYSKGLLKADLSKERMIIR